MKGISDCGFMIADLEIGNSTVFAARATSYSINELEPQ